VGKLIKFETESIDLIDGKEGTKLIKLPELTKEEIEIIDPIVAPTSGLRIQIYDIIEENKHYLLTRRKLFLFLRVFRAISEKVKELRNNQNLKILIVTDDRPSRKILLNYCSQIFAYDGFDIFYQEDELEESRVSAPYGAASVALYDDINLVIVLTASHNELSWNGIKFYIDYPIPMSGDLFKEISKKALGFDEIFLKTDIKPILIDPIMKNNEYVKDLLSDVLEIKSLKNKNIIIWPYLGKAEGIVNLFKDYGANVILVNEEINPPNPIKVIYEEKLQEVMGINNSTIAILLDADRDRIALYVKQNGEYYTYIPNEIYSALHNILAKEYNKKIINVRTIPSDLRGDGSSFINILTGVGYKHLGLILYFLLGIDVDKSKVDKGILYFEDENKQLIKIDNSKPLLEHMKKLLGDQRIENEKFIVVMWEESGGHTLQILSAKNNSETNKFNFTTKFPVIADKYPVPALVLITELISRGHVISESIDWSIVGINRTIPATDQQKIKIMKNFEKNDNKKVVVGAHEYMVHSLSDNNNMIDIYQLKRDEATLYFRASGTGPDMRFYIFGKRESHLEEIKNVQTYIKENYI
jgi:phosphomannomutase